MGLSRATYSLVSYPDLGTQAYAIYADCMQPNQTAALKIALKRYALA